MQHARYRKFNDRSLNSSTYHKKDGTNVRAILKEEARKEMGEIIMKNEKLWCVNCLGPCKHTVAEVVKNRLDQEDWGGEIENMNASIQSITSFLSNLSQKLVEKNILTQEELEELL